MSHNLSRSFHIRYAHFLWALQVKPASLILDATAGNGYDTLFLASLLDHEGCLHAIDIQKKALENTRCRLEAAYPLSKSSISQRLYLHHCCHTNIPELAWDLIVYNLGYLPGADKSIITQSASTIISLKKAWDYLKIGGALSITTYPGHLGGREEHLTVTDFLSTLKKEAEIIHSQSWEKPKAPHLFFVKKRGKREKNGMSRIPRLLQHV